jgi:hypothetical protein
MPRNKNNEHKERTIIQKPRQRLETKARNTKREPTSIAETMPRSKREEHKERTNNIQS